MKTKKLIQSWLLPVAVTPSWPQVERTTATKVKTRWSLTWQLESGPSDKLANKSGAFHQERGHGDIRIWGEEVMGMGDRLGFFDPWSGMIDYQWRSVMRLLRPVDFTLKCLFQTIFGGWVGRLLGADLDSLGVAHGSPRCHWSHCTWSHDEAEIPGAPKWNRFFKMVSGPKIRIEKKHQLRSLHLVCIMDWSSFPIFPPILSSSYDLSMDECS